MSEDLNKKLKQITEILGQDNLPDNLKGILSLFASSNNNDNERSSEEVSELPAIQKNNFDRKELEENLEMIRKVKKIMDKMKTGNDPRVTLLTAIKPFLNNKRQKNISSCVQLLQVSRISEIMEDNELKDLKNIF